MAFIDAITSTEPPAALLGSLLALIVIVFVALYITMTKPFDEPVSWRSHFLCLTSASMSYYVSFHWVTVISLFAWIAVLAATRFYMARFEAPQNQRSLARLAKQATNLVLFLRPFKLDRVTAGFSKPCTRQRHLLSNTRHGTLVGCRSEPSPSSRWL